MGCRFFSDGSDFVPGLSHMIRTRTCGVHTIKVMVFQSDARGFGSAGR